VILVIILRYFLGAILRPLVTPAAVVMSQFWSGSQADLVSQKF
jgi:hypothetical protein